METTPTRTRLIAAMADALQRRGLHGVGLNEILRDAQAPKGVLYHHFPGGKTDLAVAAIQAIVERIVASLDQVLASTPDPARAFERWVAGAQRHLAVSRFERGCPLAAGLGPIGHMGSFKARAQPSWDAALHWLDRNRAAAHAAVTRPA